MPDEIYTHCKDRTHETQHHYTPPLYSAFTFSHDFLLSLKTCELIDIVRHLIQ